MHIHKYIMLLMLCAVLMSACAGKNAESTADGHDVSAGTADDSGASAEEQAAKVVYGEIAEVIGNALTIKLIQIPEGFTAGSFIGEGATFRTRDWADGGDITLPNGTSIPVGEDGMPDWSNAELPEGLMQRMENMPEGGRGMRGGGEEGGTEFSTGGEGGALANGENGRLAGSIREQAYTGETIEVLIPVGVAVMTRTRGESGIEESEVALTSLKSGNMITITYKEDEKTIASVYVTQETIGNRIIGEGMAEGGMGMPGGGGGTVFRP